MAYGWLELGSAQGHMFISLKEALMAGYVQALSTLVFFSLLAGTDSQIWPVWDQIFQCLFYICTCELICNIYIFSNVLEEPSASTAQEKQEEKKETAMEVEDYTEMMTDPAFLQSVLENLPGVDPQSEAVKQALTKDTNSSEKDKEKDK